MYIMYIYKYKMQGKVSAQKLAYYCSCLLTDLDAPSMNFLQQDHIDTTGFPGKDVESAKGSGKEEGFPSTPAD